MSGGGVSTKLDRGVSVDDDMRALAVARVSREPDGDELLDILGLARPEAPAWFMRNGRKCCVRCERQIRRGNECVRPDCEEAS